jgi:hypothetical protein
MFRARDVRKTAVHLLSSALQCGGYAARMRFDDTIDFAQRCTAYFQQFVNSEFISKLARMTPGFDECS